MGFWSKEASRNVLNNLKNIKALSKRKDMNIVSELVKGIKTILDNIENAKKEIIQSANEEIAKPWIDTRYDKEIKTLGEKDANELEKLEKDLKDYLQYLINEKEEKQLGAAKDIISILVGKLESILEVNEKNDKRLKEISAETIKRRIESSPFLAVLNNRTRDGISWSGICKVARQLGGSIVVSGRHNYSISFPNSKRPIPLSRDVDSDTIAGEIIQELKNSLPNHKVAYLNIANLKIAFDNADLLAA